MIRVVRIITRLNIGGPARHVTVLASGLDRRAFQTLIITGRPSPDEGDLTAAVRGVGHVVTIPELGRSLRPWQDLVAWCRLFIMLMRVQPDIVHTHMAKAGALGRSAAWLYNQVVRCSAWILGRPASACRIVHTFHGHVLEGYFSPRLTRLFVIIERWLARNTDRLVAVSPLVRDDLLSFGIGRPAQWQVIPLGFDLSPFERLDPPNGASSVRVGLVGRLVPIKNPCLLLEALVKLAQTGAHAPTHAVIVGDGPLRATMEREVQRLGLDRMVEFMGWKGNIHEVYAGLQAACLTSWNEGTPVALIEAMAAARPVVATAVGGVPDLLIETPGAVPEIPPGGFYATTRGILVRPGDSEGLAAALRALATDGSLRSRLGEAGRTYVLARFRNERLCGEMMELYGHVRAGRER